MTETAWAPAAAWWAGSLPWAMAVIALLALLWAGVRLPWFKLRGDAEAQRVLLWATLLLAAMRWFNADALAGVSLHFLGATIATLMFGLRFALWVLALVSATAWLFGSAWQGWAGDFVACGLLPAVLTRGLLALAQARLPLNPFVYVLVNAFLAGALGMAASHLFKAGVESLLHAPVVGHYLIAMLPMMFAEGFFSGAVLALVVAYRPQWCATFDDARYLPRPPAA